MQVDLRTQKVLTNSRLPSPWVTKAVLTHPRGTCTRRNFSRQNGRHGDGHDSNKWMAVRSSNVQGVTKPTQFFHWWPCCHFCCSCCCCLNKCFLHLPSQVTRVHELCPQGHWKAFTQQTGPGLSNFGSHVLRTASGSGLQLPVSALRVHGSKPFKIRSPYFLDLQRLFQRKLLHLGLYISLFLIGFCKPMMGL